jgi:hypothetical protein
MTTGEAVLAHVFDMTDTATEFSGLRSRNKANSTGGAARNRQRRGSFFAAINSAIGRRTPPARRIEAERPR